MQFPSKKEIDRLNDEIKVDQGSLSIVVAIRKVEPNNIFTKLKLAYGMGTVILSGDRGDIYNEGQIVTLTWDNGNESGKPVIEILKEAE